MLTAALLTVLLLLSLATPLVAQVVEATGCVYREGDGPACGFALADQGADTRLIQDYLGHRNIQHTVRYTATNPARFEKLWR